MNESLLTKKYESKIPMNYKKQKMLEEVLHTVNGVNYVWINATSITFDFYIQLVDEVYIKKVLVKAGFLFKEKRITNFFSRFIDKLAKENKKTYGDKKLDCCDLNE